MLVVARVLGGSGDGPAEVIGPHAKVGYGAAVLSHLPSPDGNSWETAYRSIQPALDDAAVSGEEGLSLAWTQPFDLVLLDLRLPGRSGIEILKELRAIKPLLPVIIVSSLPESPYVTLARRAGAVDFVTKSALVQNLGRVVKSALGDRAMT